MIPHEDKYNFLLYIPEILTQTTRLSDDGRVILVLPINPAKKLLGKLVSREPVSDIALDELSSAAWLLIDGRRSILDIARLQSEITGDHIDESVRRIVQFMRYIAKRGWIRFKDVQMGSDSQI